MALSATLISAQLTSPSPIALTPLPRLSFMVEINDDQHGVLGVRTYEITDENIVANVMSFVEQMLPSMESQTGFPVVISTNNAVSAASVAPLPGNNP